MIVKKSNLCSSLKQLTESSHHQVLLLPIRGNVDRLTPMTHSRGNVDRLTPATHSSFIWSSILLILEQAPTRRSFKIRSSTILRVSLTSLQLKLVTYLKVDFDRLITSCFHGQQKLGSILAPRKHWFCPNFSVSDFIAWSHQLNWTQIPFQALHLLLLEASLLQQNLCYRAFF